MAVVVSSVNVLTCVAQAFAWIFLVPEFKISLRFISRATVSRVLEYSAILSTWSLSLLLVSGLDITIVGHYQFASTAYYSVAAALTNVVIMTQGAIFSPLLPAAASLATRNDPSLMGALLLRSTRYGTLLLLATGLPLFVGASLALKLWVGAGYATASSRLLQILVVANVIRLAGMPYTIMVVATGQQRLATLGTVAEAIVNFVASIWLARHFGAIGVAMGTLIGSTVNIGVHVTYSVRKTADRMKITRSVFLEQETSASGAVRVAGFVGVCRRASFFLQQLTGCISGFRNTGCGGNGLAGRI